MVGEGPDWKARYPHKLSLYAKHFDLVEVNSTFYRLPQLKTAEHWGQLAREVNPNFGFAVKVNRAITHFDRFRTVQSFEVYAQTNQIATALQAKVLLFQTPRSFRPSEENLDRVRRFFEKIDRRDHVIVFEPRGWDEKTLKTFFQDLSLIHGVDPFANQPLITKLAYFRLHGSPPGKRMYRYDYTWEDLLALAQSIAAFKVEEVYVLFNNDHMVENALAFKEILRSDKKLL
jgi:uncharacterized protein YecE (DUF72 family)